MWKKFIILLLPFVILLSCKKEEQSTTRKNLSGVLSISDYAAYIQRGGWNSFIISGITHPEGKPLGMYVRATDSKSNELYRDTVCRPDVNPFVKDTVICQFPDSIGTFIIYAVVYPKDDQTYYSSSAYVNVITVDRDVTIPQITITTEDPEAYLDERDYELYRVRNYGGTQWMLNNMHYAGTETLSLGVSHLNCIAMDPLVGRYYTWEEAMKVCPDGWTLPTDEDWAALAGIVAPGASFSVHTDFHNVAGPLMVDAYFNGTKMWEFWPSVKIPSDSTKSFLRAVPSGYCNPSIPGRMPNLLDYACFWTADENPGKSSQACYRYIYKRENDLKVGFADKNAMGMSVRCIKK